GDRPPTIHHTPPKATTKQGHKTDHGRLQELPNNSARTGNRHPTNRIIHPRPNARPRTKSQHRNSPPRYPPEVPPNTMDTKKASKVATAPQYPHTGRTAETGRSHRDTKSRGSNHSNDRQPTRQAMAQRALGQVLGEGETGKANPNMAATSQRNGGLAPQRPPPPSTIDHHTAANTCHWTKWLPRKTEGSRHLPRVRVQASQAKHQTHPLILPSQYPRESTYAACGGDQ